jgi:hypothetical protein
MDLDHWWMDHTNLVTLTSWLADNGWDASEVAYAVEKPWKYEEEWKAAVAELEAV